MTLQVAACVFLYFSWIASFASFFAAFIFAQDSCADLAKSALGCSVEFAAAENNENK